MPRSRFRLFARHLAFPVVVLFLALDVAGMTAVAPVLAAEEGTNQKDKITKRPRYDAGLTGGTIIQLETMWIPVVVSGNRRQYVGMTVQLLPNPDRLVEACYSTPWVTEALITYFNTNGLSQADRRDLNDRAFTSSLSAVVDRVAKPGIFRGVKVLDGPPAELDFADSELSLVCV
ncbi:MAG: hypothetical protein K9H25_13130 [Rhodospirillum sp.]|nr:hypothetical protein [Rhodospirillum sp.]MCF8489266.1 hypothetical protein [Rhodospirillum sp.]MCF8502727.1 hypothetical protein [Rhodospirillum sp.]